MRVILKNATKQADSGRLGRQLAPTIKARIIIIRY